MAERGPRGRRTVSCFPPYLWLCPFSINVCLLLRRNFSPFFQDLSPCDWDPFSSCHCVSHVAFVVLFHCGPYRLTPPRRNLNSHDLFALSPPLTHAAGQGRHGNI